jgi:hypothetical protein
MSGCFQGILHSMSYLCPGCKTEKIEPICDECGIFLTDDLRAAEAFMTPMPLQIEPMEWCTCFGHWGDVFACVGVIREKMRQTGQATVNVLYVGRDLAIVDWLRLQPFVGEVIGLRSHDDHFYRRFWYVTTRPDVTAEVWLGMLHEVVRGLPEAKAFTQTQVCTRWFGTRDAMPALLWGDARLPDPAQNAAYELMEPIRGAQAIYHLHPLSTWSEGANNHWPHWLAAIEWLIERTPYTYVLTGMHDIMFLPKSPRLVNLIGRTSSNLDVLAISRLFDGVISTPNSVALWSAIDQQKLLCVGNLATGNLTSYYRRFIEKSLEATYTNVDTSLSAFQARVCGWLGSSE